MNPSNYGKGKDDRRVTRMHQMEMMEAAARGTAPTMQLDTSAVPGPGGTSGLRSRSASHNSSATAEARRFLSGEEEDYHQSGPSGTVGTTTVQTGRGTTSAGAASLFNEHDKYSVDQSINLMDPATESYIPVPAKMGRTSFVDIFLGGAGSTSGTGDTRRGTIQTTWQQSVGGRVCLLVAFLGFGVFLAMSVSFLFQDPNEGNAGGGFVKTGNRDNDIKTFLLLNSASHTEYLTDKTTPAYHALRWLRQTDPAKLEADDDEMLARFALATFYYATHPDQASDHSSGKVTTIDSGWTKDTNWMSEKSVCDWYGIDCDTIGSSSHKDVVHFNMTRNQVEGTIPLELKSLSNMVLLDLSNNRLHGSIPVPIFRMFQITYLLLQNNRISGTLPNQVGLLEGAYELYLNDNNIDGTIPTTLANLSNLKALFLENNALEGSIPDLSGLSGLNHLNLGNNTLTSALPFSVAKLTNLHDLRLNLNQLTGTLPPELATNKNLRLLYLGNNQLSGKIPDMFDDLRTLTDLELHNNKFVNTLPKSFRYLTSLRRLTIDENKLSGSLPPEWGEMTDLEALGMHHNRIVGPIPSEFSGMTNLVHIFLNHNFLEDELPSELAKLTKLKDLYLESNAIKGKIPTELAKLSNLASFRIFKNIVTGTMPSGLCDLTKKKQLTDLEADCEEIECSCCTQCH